MIKLILQFLPAALTSNSQYYHALSNDGPTLLGVSTAAVRN